jgi:hypothetical protein
MSEPQRLIEIGTLPSGFDATFIAEGGVDPLAVMIREGNARLDAERAAEAKALAAKAADLERVRNTKRARALRRLTRAFKSFARIK